GEVIHLVPDLRACIGFDGQLIAGTSRCDAQDVIEKESGCEVAIRIEVAEKQDWADAGDRVLDGIAAELELPQAVRDWAAIRQRENTRGYTHALSRGHGGHCGQT